MKSTHQTTAHAVNETIGWFCLFAECFAILICSLVTLTNAGTLHSDEAPWALCLYPIIGFIGWLPVGALWEFLAQIADNTSN